MGNPIRDVCPPPFVYGLCPCVTLLMLAPFNPFHGLAPDQFEPVAAIAVYGHCKQSLTYEVNQGADKVDYQQDAENLQDREGLLVEVLQYEQALPKQCSRGGMIGDQVNRECGCTMRLMIRLRKESRSNSRNMPKPTMMTGSLNDPVMKMPLSIPSNDNTTEAHVYKRKNPSPVPVISQVCLSVNGFMYHLHAEMRMNR